MYKTIFSIIACLLLLASFSSDRSDEVERLKKELAGLKEIAGPPPASLENLYPPKAEAPVFQFAMFEMATPFTGFVLKMFEGDMDAAKNFYQMFKSKYQEASNLVPEWKAKFPVEPVEELGMLIEGGDPGKVMEAVGKVGAVCHSCHLVNMPKVQYKYHWPEFSAIGVTDPVTQKDVEFKQFMQSLETSFTGTLIELKMGQFDKARKHFEAVKAGMNNLKESCQGCHTTERKYFVDESIQTLVDKLGSTINSPSPDMKLIGELSQQIGMESCGKCHHVHIPAAYAKERWAMQSEFHDE